MRPSGDNGAVATKNIGWALMNCSTSGVISFSNFIFIFHPKQACGPKCQLPWRILMAPHYTINNRPLHTPQHFQSTRTVRYTDPFRFIRFIADNALQTNFTSVWKREEPSMKNLVLGVAAVCGLLAITPQSPAQTTEPYVWANAQVVGGGFVSGIIVNPNFPVIYCRTDIGGAYRWDKAKGQWIPLTDWVDAEHWNYMGTESVAIDPENGSRVFIAAGMYTNGSAGNAAVLRSADQGKKWKVSQVPFKMGGNENGRNNGERLSVDPNDGNVLYLGTRHAGLWRSVDAAAHWEKVASFPAEGDDGQGIVFAKFDKAGGKRSSPTPVIYVGVSSKGPSLFRSTDAGESWQPVPGAPSGLLPHKAAWDKDRNLYLTYGDAPGPNGVNDGAVWKFNAASDQWSEITPVRPGGNDKFGYQGITVDEQHPQTVMVSTLDRYAAGDDIFRSNDGGQTWKAIGPISQRDFQLAPWLRFGKDPAPNQPIGHWIASVEIDPFESNHAMFSTGWGIWTTNNLTDADRGGIVRWQVGPRASRNWWPTR